MSKRYVIQVLETVVGENGEPLENVGEWKNVQHSAGGDWMTRSSRTAIADAAKLVHAGETRELRIGVSKPVYEVTPAIDMEQILAAKAAINWADADDFEDEVDEDEEEDAEYDGEDDDDTDDGSEDVDNIDDVVLNQDELDENDAPIAFELVDEPGSDGNAHNNDGPAYTHGDDPTGN